MKLQRRAGERNVIGRRPLLLAVVIAVAGPLMVGLVNAPRAHAQSAQTTAAPSPSFEVASIKSAALPATICLAWEVRM